MKKSLLNCRPILLFGLIGMTTIIACTQEVQPIAELPPISFNQKVMPIIAAGCTASGCHGNERTEEFTLLSYEDVIKHGDVKAADARGSKLYRVITTPTGGVMPPSPNEPLSEEQVGLIYLWILQGAKNN
jgi:hypothetical protein